MTAAVPFIVAAVLLAGLIAYLVWRWRATSEEVPPGAYAAGIALWCEHWALPIKALPLLMAVRQRRLNCGSGRGWLDLYGRCVAGETSLFATGPICKVAFPDRVPLWETALAHEFAHARRWHLDPATVNESEAASHAAPGFMDAINAANAWLKARNQESR